MPTFATETVRITIDVPTTVVSADLADASTHVQWATEFFSGSAEPAGDGTWRVTVPRMGGPARMRVDARPELGVVDLYLAPEGAPFGPPLPVRVVPNGDGCDVLFTLARFPGQTDEEWNAGLESMRRELENLRRRLQL